MGSRIVIWVGGSDGQGYSITVGSDGKLHFHKVPGWDPGVQLQFDAAAAVLQRAALAKDTKIEDRLVALAQEILMPIAPQISASILVK